MKQFDWKQSIYGDDGGVEVKSTGKTVLVRSSENPETVLEFNNHAWMAFQAGVHMKEFM